MPAAASAQVAQRGLLDLRKVDFAERAHVSLSGEWEFYMSDLVTPGELATRKPVPEYIDFPSTWNARNKTQDPGSGYATYRLRVLLAATTPMALEMPHFYSSYALWINGQRIAGNGKVGTTKAEMEPQWLPQVVNLPTQRDTLDILIHVSNFHHAMGGVREPILIGDSQALSTKHSIAVASYIIMCSFLVLIAVMIFLIYMFSKHEPSMLFLAGLSVTWAARSMFSNIYLANSLVSGIPWEVCVRIEYITLYLSMIWAILFLGTLFRNEVNPLFKYLFTICNGMFAVVTLFFDAAIYTRFLPVYLSFAAGLLIYVIYVLIRAIVYERENVWLMVSCLFLAVILFSYDLISYEGLATFNPIITSIGYLAIFVLMSLSLLYKLGLLKRSSVSRNVLTYEELYGPSKGSK